MQNTFLREKNIKADAIGNVYRSAFYMAKGEKKRAIVLVEKIKTVSLELYEKAWGILSFKLEDKIVAENLLDLYLSFLGRVPKNRIQMPLRDAP